VRPYDLDFAWRVFRRQILSVLFLSFLTTHASAFLAVVTAQMTAPETATPAEQVNLGQFGYRGLSTENRFLKASNVTVTLLDNNHVLFTFNPKKAFSASARMPSQS
jgi:hypothetical protein